MITVFIVLQVLIAISLVVIILLQHGKGADIGSAFGGGNNNAMFAPADATNILTKITWGLVIAFFFNYYCNFSLSKNFFRFWVGSL